MLMVVAVFIVPSYSRGVIVAKWSLSRVAMCVTVTVNRLKAGPLWICPHRLLISLIYRRSLPP